MMFISISAYHRHQSSPSLPPAGQIFSQSLANVRDQYKTGEGSPDDDDSYLGYSVTTGEFILLISVIDISIVVL